MRLTAIAIRFGMLLLALSASVHASVVHNTQQVAFQAFVPCANQGQGEIVDLSGAFNTIADFRVDGSTFSGFYMFQPAGMTGVGETTGNQYHAVGSLTETFKEFVPATSDGTYHFAQTFQLVGNGTAENFLFHTTQTFTIFDNGNFLTIKHENFVVDCKEGL
jgi:hypothetical protein